MLSYLKTQYNVTDYSEHGTLENIEAVFITYRIGRAYASRQGDRLRRL